MTIMWCMVPERLSATNRIFCHFGLFFALLLPLKTQKIKILKKMKKTPGNIIILHMSTTNENHLIYDFWDIERNRHNFFSFLDHFALSPPPFLLPLTTQRIKTLTKWKKHWRYHHFTQVYNKWQSYDIWFLRYEVQQTEFFVILGHFLLF